MAEKNSWVVETETHIEAGLIDLPINYTLHLPKKISMFAYFPNSRPKKHQHSSSVRLPKQGVLHFAAQITRHPSATLAILHAGTTVLARAVSARQPHQKTWKQEELNKTCRSGPGTRVHMCTCIRKKVDRYPPNEKGVSA